MNPCRIPEQGSDFTGPVPKYPMEALTQTVVPYVTIHTEMVSKFVKPKRHESANSTIRVKGERDVDSSLLLYSDEHFLESRHDTDHTE